jgi:CubicO group peptidase (beta-lactamase class C family)
MSVAVMQAIEDGLLELDSDVNDVVPFRVRNPRHPDAPITLRMLLTHTSSIRDKLAHHQPFSSHGDSDIPLGEYLGRYLDPDGDLYQAHRSYSAWRPEGRYDYCNIAASLAGFMVEAASGVSFDGWCDGRIFAARHGPHELASRRARSNGDRHALPLEGRGVRGVRTVRLSGRSAPDDRPRTRVTSARSWRSASSTASGSSTRTPVREMRRTQFPDVAHGQGLIWYRFALRGMPLMGHNGGDSGVATQMYFRPSDGVGVIALSNGNWRRDGSGWPLQRIAVRLFEEADRG